MDWTNYKQRLQDAISLIENAKDLISDVRDDMINDEIDLIDESYAEMVNQLDNIADYDLNDVVLLIDEVIEDCDKNNESD